MLKNFSYKPHCSSSQLFRAMGYLSELHNEIVLCLLPSPPHLILLTSWHCIKGSSSLWLTKKWRVQWEEFFMTSQFGCPWFQAQLECMEKPFTELLGSPLAELSGIRNVFPILVLTRKGSQNGYAGKINCGHLIIIADDNNSRQGVMWQTASWVLRQQWFCSGTTVFSAKGGDFMWSKMHVLSKAHVSSKAAQKLAFCTETWWKVAMLLLIMSYRLCTWR